MEKKISATDARQGRRGTHILTVLVVALVLAGAAWLGAEFYGESIDRNASQQPGAVEQTSPQTAQPSGTQSQTTQ